MNKLIRGVGILGLAVVTVIGSQFAAAQQAGQGLEITPPRLNVSADPGDVIETELRIRNVTEQTLVTKAQYNDFVAGSEEDGNPKILLDEDAQAEPSPFSIKDWIATIPEVTLKPTQQEVIKVTLTVPDDASPGGHYGVIRFTGTPPEVDSSAVSLSASIGALVLVTVSGDIQESTSVAEIYTSQNNERRSLFEYGPVTINTRVQNDGNVHNQPSGNIVVSNMFGQTVDTLKFNENGGNVLPKSIRRFENTLQKRLMLGRYKIQADIVYGVENQIISSSATFWVIPYKLIAIGLAIIAAFVISIRRYNRYIISRAKSSKSEKSDSKKK